MNGAPAECPECAKVILNGDIASRNLEATCEAIERHLDAGFDFPNIKDLVKQANLIEDETDKFRRMVLDGIGFKGPYPKSLGG
jgi:hypothetical protein